jgi:hypothetical protein
LALRFSSITVEGKSPEATSQIDLAAEVLADGKKEGRETGHSKHTAWYHEDENSEQDGKPIFLRFWYAGYKNHKIIVSFCCQASDKKRDEVQQTIALVPRLFTKLVPRGTVSALTTHESQMLDDQRALVAEVLQTQYDTYAVPKLKSDLPSLQRFVDEQAFDQEQQYEWTCLGVAFGDVIANELGLDWIAQCDEYGVEPALNLKGTTITVFPRTMILKRVEKGEHADLEHILSQLANHVEEMKREGC